jgi:hypothetical protein
VSERKPQIRLGMIGAVGHGKATLNAAIGNVLARRNPAPELSTRKHYLAKLRGSSGSVGAYAENGAKAKHLLERKYGKGNILLVHLAEGDRGALPRIQFLTDDDIAIE